MSSSPDPSSQNSGQRPSIYSHNGEIILVAITTLLVVIAFVLSLHICARRFFINSSERRRSSVSNVLGSPLELQLQSVDSDELESRFSVDGLDSSTVASLPILIYRSHDHKCAMECVVCLTLFEDNDQVKLLPKCNHGFHVKCIDTWLLSHSTCPICRADARWEEESTTLVPSLSISVLIEAANHDPPRITNDSGVVNELVNDNSVSEASIDISPGERSENGSSEAASSSSSFKCSLRRMFYGNGLESNLVHSSH